MQRQPELWGSSLHTAMAKTQAGQRELPRPVGFEKETLIILPYLFFKKCFFFFQCVILESPAGGVVNKTQFPMLSIKPSTRSSGEADPEWAF